MNFHYIDYINRERRREELEECEKQRSFGLRRLQPCGSMPKVIARTEGEGQ